MKKIYFRFKLWPDREHRKMPADDCLLPDEPNIYEMYRFRQEVWAYYRNWIDVWRTYSWLNMFTPLLIPVVGLLAQSWLTAIAFTILYVGWARFIGKKKYSLWTLKILVPGFIDPKLVPHFGSLLPFEDNRN